MSLAELKDEELLNLRICDLKVVIDGTWLERSAQRLYNELDDKRINFHPPCYLADEWFVSEGDTSIGIPFYLAHPRLKRLEEKMMLEVEGGTKTWCMKLLRHETGHAIYHAYLLNKKKTLQKVFGPRSKTTSQNYRPKPYSKGFVRHLDRWYAQSGPDEDFAETFATWLTPEFDWREHYRGWKAIQKLEYMDQLMKDITGKPPRHTSRGKPYAASSLKLKLKTHYRQRRKLYEEDYPDFYDPDLRKIFSDDPSFIKNELARNFLRRNGKNIVGKVSSWTGEKKFTVNSLLKNLIERCEDLSLRIQKGEMESALDVTAYLASMVSNHLFTGKFKRSV